MPIGVFAGDAGRLLVTFVGLIAASILPSITLLINSMTASVGSVKAINELNAELDSSIDALLLMFGLAGLVTLVLVALSIPTPRIVGAYPIILEALPRAGQFLIGFFAGLAIVRLGQIPGILRRALAVRHRIASEEARRATLEKAPGPLEVKSAFPTTPGFGKTVQLAELTARESGTPDSV